MGSFTKGDGILKQVLISMVVVVLTAGIFVGMVMHSVVVLRQVQLKILTGEYAPVQETTGENLYNVHIQ